MKTWNIQKAQYIHLYTTFTSTLLTDTLKLIRSTAKHNLIHCIYNLNRVD